MKKGKLLLFSFICFICLFLTTGCFNKTAIDAEEFKVVMDQKEFSIVDATSQFTKLEYVKKVYVAMSSDSKYQIEFYQFSEDSDAKEFYNANKKDFEDAKGSGVNTETNVSLGNHDKYTLTTDNKYQVVSRIGNTGVFVDADKTYKEDIKTILEDLGY